MARMANENFTKSKQGEYADFRTDDWYTNARERFSILNYNRRREFLLALASRPRRMKSGGYSD
jgi:hypothetical protein